MTRLEIDRGRIAKTSTLWPSTAARRAAGVAVLAATGNAQQASDVSGLSPRTCKAWQRRLEAGEGLGDRDRVGRPSILAGEVRQRAREVSSQNSRRESRFCALMLVDAAAPNTTDL